MKTFWDRVWAVHDMSGFGHMHRLVPGVPFYCDRALLLPAEAVIVHENGSGRGVLDEYLAWLRSPEVALGPGKVRRVAGDDLFGGIMSDSAVLGELRQATARGARLQLFCMTPRAESFLREAMIDERRVDSAPLEIARRMNDKAELRRIGAEIGLSHAFLDHVVADRPDKIVEAVASFLSRPRDEVPFVVLKRTDLAGGDGFLRVDRQDDLRAVLEPYFERHLGEKILVEEGHAHDALSLQVAVRKPKSFATVGWTMQIVHRRLGQHYGNSMVRLQPGREHPGIGREDRVTMETWAQDFARYAAERIVGYHGTIGFDFIRLKRPRKRDGRGFFLLECNARQTASTYALAVSHQLEGRGAGAWGIVMLNAVPCAAASVGEALDRLGGLRFSTSRGVLLFNPRLLTLDPPRCGLIAVGSDPTDAGKMLGEAKRRLAA